jgi:hypothetical protein
MKNSPSTPLQRRQHRKARHTAQRQAQRRARKEIGDRPRFLVSSVSYNALGEANRYLTPHPR